METAGLTAMQKASEIVEEFNALENWDEKYKNLIKRGRKLNPMQEQYKQDKFLVKGCQSQVWLFPEFKEGRITFHADSDSVLVKGILAVLLFVYSGNKPSEIMEQKSEFLDQVGITDHLSMNRSNGLAAMIKQIQMYAFTYKALEK